MPDSNSKHEADFPHPIEYRHWIITLTNSCFFIRPFDPSLHEPSMDIQVWLIQLKSTLLYSSSAISSTSHYNPITNKYSTTFRISGPTKILLKLLKEQLQLCTEAKISKNPKPDNLYSITKSIPKLSKLPTKTYQNNRSSKFTTPKNPSVQWSYHANT